MSKEANPPGLIIQEIIAQRVRETILGINGGIMRVLDRVDTTATVTEQRFTSIQADVQELRASNKKIILEQSKSRSEIMGRIGRLQETVELMREDARA
jgi:hypothetical protein